MAAEGRTFRRVASNGCVRAPAPAYSFHASGISGLTRPRVNNHVRKELKDSDHLANFSTNEAQRKKGSTPPIIPTTMLTRNATAANGLANLEAPPLRPKAALSSSTPDTAETAHTPKSGGE
mmetsp:Transcript_11267/g.9581  ORF Transcript_11267/g.9581 Transcript_11267/m.9581 type:complete len:121 (+) Transcript_11267:123-485(+)